MTGQARLATHQSPSVSVRIISYSLLRSPAVTINVRQPSYEYFTVVGNARAQIHTMTVQASSDVQV